MLAYMYGSHDVYACVFKTDFTKRIRIVDDVLTPA
jgi:hypothetical protein